MAYSITSWFLLVLDIHCTFSISVPPHRQLLRRLALGIYIIPFVTVGQCCCV